MSLEQRKRNIRATRVMGSYRLERQDNGWWRAVQLSMSGREHDVITHPDRSYVVARAWLCWRRFKHQEEKSAFDRIFNIDALPIEPQTVEVSVSKVGRLIGSLKDAQDELLVSFRDSQEGHLVSNALDGVGSAIGYLETLKSRLRATGEKS